MDHPYLVVHSATAPGAAEAQKKLQEEEAQVLLQGICGVCHDPLEDPVVSVCQHAFCRACMMEYMDGAQGQAKCPSCDKPLSVDLNANPSVGSPMPLGKGQACDIPLLKHEGCWQSHDVLCALLFSASDARHV